MPSASSAVYGLACFGEWMMNEFRKEFFIETVLYKTKSQDGTKPNTNPNPNTNPIQLFYAVFEHRPMIFKLASFVRFSHRSSTVLLAEFISCCSKPTDVWLLQPDVLQK